MESQSTTQTEVQPTDSIEVLTETLLPLSTTLANISSSNRELSRESRKQTQGIQEQNISLRLISITMMIVFIAILASLIYLIRDTLTIIMISFLIAYILAPLVDYFEGLGIPRSLAVTGVTLGILAEVVIGLIFVVTTVANQLDQLQASQDQAMVGQVEQILNSLPPVWQTRLIELLRVEVDASGSSLDTQQVIEASMKRLEELIIGQSNQIIGATRGLFSAFINGIIILFTSFFFLSGGRKMKKAFMRSIPNRIFEPILVLLDGIDQQLGDYLRSRVIQTGIIAAVCMVGYVILGLPLAIILGVIAGLANLIPYIGPFLGAIPAIIMVLVGSRFGLGTSLGGIAIITVGVQIIDTALITPLLIGKSVELDPITTVVVVLVGEQLLGLIGMLMAVPLTAMLKLICQELVTQFRGYSRSFTYGSS